MEIKRASQEHLNGIQHLLKQVLTIHHTGRPDLFRAGTTKYTNGELEEMLKDDARPIFVAADEAETVLGYAFCVFQQHEESHVLTDIKTLYIDDLCVDEALRGQQIGRALYEYVLEFAKKSGCYNVTLNVWTCNPQAMRFYEKCGLTPQKIGMEKILE
ncbi:MAG: GNAT family N-acetyltransferase [bacterium]|nr:GNAT family N-acetyltransferase [bacterium]